MQKNGNTDHEDAAKLTIGLVDHSQTPDRVSDAVLETLIEMSAEVQINIWHRETGLSVEPLAALTESIRQAPAIDAPGFTVTTKPEG